MERESAIAIRNQTVQRRTFGYLRGDIKDVVKTINRNSDKKDPYDVDRLLLGVIDNRSRAPIKFKLPQIDIILTEFKSKVLGKVDPTYLSKMYDITSRRKHQGRGNPRRFGTERWFMKYAYGKLFKIVYDELNRPANSEVQIKPFFIRGSKEPVQMRLPLTVPHASRVTPKRA